MSQRSIWETEMDIARSPVDLATKSIVTHITDISDSKIYITKCVVVFLYS
jgi:hypothetical protein